MPLLNTIIC